MKRIIQNQILKNDDKLQKKMTADFAKVTEEDQIHQSEHPDGAVDKDLIWDTEQMRQIIRSQIPLGDIILDDEFFESQPMLDFKPVPSINGVIAPCQMLIKLIQKDLNTQTSIENSIFNMT